MILQPILAIIILSNLRKSLKAEGILSKWYTIVIGGTAIFIALLVLHTTIKSSRPVIDWVAHALTGGLLYLIFTQKDFRSAKGVAYAFVPLLIINLIEDIVKLIDPVFYKHWENYFETGAFFAFVWMVAMVIVTNRQKKALEKEKQKAAEKEKEYRITETLKASLEIQVKERTAELTQQKEELQQTVNELKATQSQLVQSEKMASLGELTAGIAHEIQNPLNFVNNFSEVNAELIAEMKEAISKGDFEEVKALANDIADNEQKINHHGKRADAIVKGMLQHSRSSSGVKEPTDINALADEYLRLAYHGLRAKDKSFNATMKTDFDESIGNINVIPQDMGRVILNLITNAFYAVTEKKKESTSTEKSGLVNLTSLYEPTVSVSTKKINNKVEIKVSDNGNGIPQKVLDKIFQPFFTTKPTGQGTGLGLSMSYDIVTKGHGGELKVTTKDGQGAEFIIILPV
ncbi:sensor histidine kinase [Ferruginibacter sp. SUN106]|uniref:sensor histidine kinase n=1 Tax=Ferruginibacter sp. SUN106 TaxID=2978348 RepID=UPI003D35E8BE